MKSILTIAMTLIVSGSFAQLKPVVYQDGKQ